MCNLSQGVWEKGVEKGCEEGIQELVLSLQKFLKDQALVAKEVAEQFGLSQEAAAKSLQQNWMNGCSTPCLPGRGLSFFEQKRSCFAWENRCSCQ